MPANFHPPTLSLSDAQSMAARLYGVTGTAKPLPSERDQNFHVQADDGVEYVLKVANSAEERATLEMQNGAVRHLAARGIDLWRVIPSLAGNDVECVTAPDGSAHLARLLTYLPGRVLAQVRPHTPELLAGVGDLLGRIDRGLADYAHPAAKRDLKWDLARALWIKSEVGQIADERRRGTVERFVALYETQIVPAWPSLRHSIIYNDANDHNVIITGCGVDKRVTGMVDFGDMVHSAVVGDLAIACAYAIMDKPDPVSAAAQIVAGYHRAYPLTEAELAALFPMIAMRLCVSVVNSAIQQKLHPANKYLTISEQPAWGALERLAAVSPQFAHFAFRHACGLPASPTSPAVVVWLRANAAQVGRLVNADLKGDDTLVFDLGIDSRELGNQTDLADTDAFTRQLFERMRLAGANVGIGRFDEPRPIYTTDMFRIEGNEGPEWRTVHLGLDLFMPPGAAVFAPLDGTVHSFANNTAPLDYGPTIVLQHTVDDGRLTFYTLYGHLSADSLEGLQVGMPVEQGSEIARIGNFPVNGGWPPHLHFQIVTDMLGRDGEFPGVARPGQRALWASISPDPNLMAGIPAERLGAHGLAKEKILATRAKYIGPSLSISYRKPLKIVRGSMQYLYDENGRKYLDAVNNVPHVGHSHPRVVRAGQAQMAVLNTNTRYLHDDLVQYAERLVATLPEPLSVCYFVCSGSEANELALRLARTHTSQRDMIVVDVAYHGNTGGLIEISPYKFDGPGGAGAPPHTHVVPMPDDYRGAYKRGDAQAGIKYAQAVGDAIAATRQAGRGVAGFICESLLSCGGQIVLPPGYLTEAYRLTRAAGGVCIADEVQVGFGRVGTHFWGFETQGVVPDIVTMGKPIGNGHPLAAVVTTPEIAASFNNGMEYFNTFGGNPVSCAIGLAVLDVIRDERLQAHALEVGNHLMDGLRGLIDRHPLVGDVRGLGLFVGIELVRSRETLEPADREASYVANRMKERGILLSTDGPYHNVLKIKPPLVFTKDDADFLVRTLDDILYEDELVGL
ncbi:MAG: aminotransferase class III-fold pyridoxal phosphate-dependent enzyme [Chloroflexi bacterium]|nr:aminotransferase class III-fold pyridoxal phosphate-dependent enzyme [Chloroflexota bacterium]